MRARLPETTRGTRSIAGPLAGLVVLCYGLFIAGFSLAGFPDRADHGRAMPYLSDKPLGEDAFYMMTMGWNLGGGQGLSVAGRRTTGTQPLMTLVYGGLAAGVRAAGGDTWAFARAVLVLNAVLLIAFGGVMAALARALARPDDATAVASFATILTVTNYTLFRAFTYGLETGLYLIVAGACVLASMRVIRARSPLAVGAFGACAGLAALVRIDFLVVLALFLAVAALRRQVRLRDAAVAGSVAMAVVSPWFVWVYQVTGSWMPISGQSQSAVLSLAAAPGRLLAMVWALTHHASPWVYPELLRGAVAWGAPDAALSKLAVSAVLLAAAAVVVRGARGHMRHDTWQVMVTWLYAVAFLAAVYLVFFWPAYFYTRYTALLGLISIPVLAAGLHGLAGRRLRPTVVLGACLALFGVTAIASLHRGQAGNTYAITASFIDVHVPATETVGAFSSGVFGYFFDNVVNLDGKVNPAAMAARREGRLGRYMNESGITLLLDWTETIETFVPHSYLERCWEPCTAQLVPEQGRCFTRRPCGEGPW